MSHHKMRLSEADPSNQGFIRHYYATIDVLISNNYWVWRQVDANGKYFGSPSKNFNTEHEAKNNALEHLNGDEWI